MQDHSVSGNSLNESGISGADELLKNIGGSFTTSEENEWDNTIIPLKNQFNRRGQITGGI